jgi:hypothetical protein
MPAPEPVRRNFTRIYAIGLGICIAGIFLGVLLQHGQVGGQKGSIAALVLSVIGMGCLCGLLVGSDRSPSPGPAARERRANLRNYGVSFLACGLGVIAGFLLHRSGWGGSFGSIVAVLAGLLGLFCGGAFLWALKG